MFVVVYALILMIKLKLKDLIYRKISIQNEKNWVFVLIIITFLKLVIFGMIKITLCYVEVGA